MATERTEESRARYAWCLTCDGWILRKLLRDAPAGDSIFIDETTAAPAGKVCPDGHPVQDAKPAPAAGGAA